MLASLVERLLSILMAAGVLMVVEHFLVKILQKLIAQLHITQDLLLNH